MGSCPAGSMRLEVTGCFDTSHFNKSLFNRGVNSSMSLAERMKIFTQNVFLVHSQTILEMLEFVSKRPVSYLECPRTAVCELSHYQHQSSSKIYLCISIRSFHMMSPSLHGRRKEGRGEGGRKVQKRGKEKGTPAIRAGVFVFCPPFS